MRFREADLLLSEDPEISLSLNHVKQNLSEIIERVGEEDMASDDEPETDDNSVPFCEKHIFENLSVESFDSS